MRQTHNLTYHYASQTTYMKDTTAGSWICYPKTIQVTILCFLLFGDQKADSKPPLCWDADMRQTSGL